VVEGQPGFPLGVGQRWAVGFEEGRHRLVGEVGWLVRIAATEGAWAIAPVMSPTRWITTSHWRMYWSSMSSVSVPVAMKSS
jgi:hypothetical protein